MKIDKVHKITGGIIINCECDTPFNNWKFSKNDLLGSYYSVETVKKYNPRNMMKNVYLQDVENYDQLLNNEIFPLINLNENFTLKEMKIVAKIKFHNSLDFRNGTFIKNIVFVKRFYLY